LAFSVSAWHCTDTDAVKPKLTTTVYGTQGYGAWGDNGLLNGTASGWSADGKAPVGCTGTQGNYKCLDHCDGTTLVEYYCGDLVKNVSKTVTYQYCKNETVTDHNNCTYKKYPNGSYIYKDGKKVEDKCGTKVVENCKPKTKQVWALGTTGETVIFSKFYKDSNQCVPETPEFGGIAAGVAVIGAIAGVVILRKRQ
jgi:hypothetical protein